MALSLPRKNPPTSAAPIEEQKSNMANVVHGSQPPASMVSDVGHEILYRAIFELRDRLASLSLQRAATRTLRVVDLHNRRDAVSKKRKVPFRDVGLDVAHNVPAATAYEAGTNRVESDILEEGASAECRSTGSRLPDRLFGNYYAAIFPTYGLALVSFHRSFPLTS